MEVRVKFRWHGWVVVALLGFLLVPAHLNATGFSPSVPGGVEAQAEREQDRETSCVTLVVRGMMKSKSGAT